MSRRFLSFPRNFNTWLTLLLAPALSLSAQIEEGETIEINGESQPVHGDIDVGNVTLVITENGTIHSTDEAAISGNGENWTVENSGYLYRQGGAGATVQLAEGSFENDEDGKILWESDSDLTISTDGEDNRFSSVFLESWIADSTNLGEIRASGNHRLVLEANNSSIDLTAVHLGGRAKEDEDDFLTFRNSGTISANLSGEIDVSGTGNNIRITGVHVEELEWLDNDGTIEAVFDGSLDELAAGNSLDVAGIRSDADADIFNFEEGVIRAKIDGTGAIAGGFTLSATGIESSGELTLVNRGTIEAVVTDGIPQTDATAIIAGDGVNITNNSTGEILAHNHGDGTATGISVFLAEEISAQPENDENADDENGENGENENGNDGENGEEPPAPRRSTITNHGTISALAGENGTATAISSDGNLTVSNSGTIEAGGIIISDEDEDEIERAEVSNATGIHVRNGDGDITNSGTISAEGGFAVILEEGGILRNRGEIIGDVFLGADEDATLSIAPDSTIDGNVDAGGGTNTLELGGGNPFAWSQGEYDGSFENFSKLNVVGNNTIWTLTNDQEYADGTTINAGALLTSDQLISDVTIGQNGTFISSGSVIGNIKTSGGILAGTLDEENYFIAPEGGAVLRVDGDLTFEDGSYLQVIAGETSLEATGNIVIGSQNPDEEGEAPQLFLIDAEWDQDYLILTGDSITGEFDRGFGFILLDVIYDETSVNARLGINRAAIEEAGENSNQRGIARVLAQLDPEAGSDLEAAFREFAEIGNEQNFGIIAATMNGEIIASGAAAHSSINRTVRQTVINTIQYRPNLYDDRFAPPPGTSYDEIRARERNFWARTLSISGDLERQNDEGDVDYRLHGVVAGYDTLWTENVRAGVAVALGDSKVSRGPDKVEGNVYQVLLYASKHDYGFLYDATLGYGYHDLDSRRRVLPGDTNTKASYGAHEIFGSAQVTMILQEEGVMILPIAGIEFSHFRQESFKESGVWGLSGSSTDFSSFRPFVGIRILAEHLTGGGGSVVPEIRFRLSNELLDRDARFSASFANDRNGGQFSTTGAKFNGTEFEGGVGAMIQPGGWEQVSIFADYDFSVQRQHAVSLGLRYNF